MKHHFAFCQPQTYLCLWLLFREFLFLFKELKIACADFIHKKLLQVKNPDKVDKLKLLLAMKKEFSNSYWNWKRESSRFKFANLVVAILVILIQVIQVILKTLMKQVTFLANKKIESKKMNPSGRLDVLSCVFAGPRIQRHCLLFTFFAIKNSKRSI